MKLDRLHEARYNNNSLVQQVLERARREGIIHDGKPLTLDLLAWWAAFQMAESYQGAKTKDIARLFYNGVSGIKGDTQALENAIEVYFEDNFDDPSVTRKEMMDDLIHDIRRFF